MQSIKMYKSNKNHALVAKYFQNHRGDETNTIKNEMIHRTIAYLEISFTGLSSKIVSITTEQCNGIKCIFIIFMELLGGSGDLKQIVQ